MKYVEHQFFCINCGKENFSIQRNAGNQRKKGHLKKLWCFNCQQEINMVECRTVEDVWEFQEDFENGIFKEEAEKSLSHVGDSCIG